MQIKVTESYSVYRNTTT